MHISLYHNGIVMFRAFCLLVAATLGGAQVIEFESGGLKYQTLTRNSVTVMFAHLPTRVHEYAIIQVAVSNGAQAAVVIRPEDITFERSDGVALRATPARAVVTELIGTSVPCELLRYSSAIESGCCRY